MEPVNSGYQTSQRFTYFFICTCPPQFPHLQEIILDSIYSLSLLSQFVRDLHLCLNSYDYFHQIPHMNLSNEIYPLFCFQQPSNHGMKIQNFVVTPARLLQRLKTFNPSCSANTTSNSFNTSTASANSTSQNPLKVLLIHLSNPISFQLIQSFEQPSTMSPSNPDS